MSVVESVRQKGAVGGRVRCGEIARAREFVGYEVVFDDAAATLMEALGAACDGGAVPDYYHARGPLVLAEKRGWQTEGDGRVWRVRCVYRFPWPGEEPRPAEAETGAKWGVVVEVLPRPVVREVFADAAGVALTAPEGTPIEKVCVDSSDDGFYIAFSTDALDLAAYDDCRDKVNADEVVIRVGGQDCTFPAGSLLCWRLRAAPTVDVTGVAVVRVRVVLLRREHLEEGWRRRLARRGWYEVIGGERTPIRDPAEQGGGAPAAAPFLKLDGDDLVVLEQGGVAQYDDFDCYGSADFGSLLEGLS